MFSRKRNVFKGLELGCRVNLMCLVGFRLPLGDEKDEFSFLMDGLKLSQNRKKLVATMSCCERVYKRTGEPSVTFCGKEERRCE